MSSRTNGIAAEASGDGFEVLPLQRDINSDLQIQRPHCESRQRPFESEVRFRGAGRRRGSELGRAAAASLRWLVRIALDRRGGFLQERPPPVRDRFDLREDLRFFLRRNIRPPIGELVQFALELGPELPPAKRRGGPNRLLQLLHSPGRKAIQDVEQDPYRQDDGRGDDHGLDEEQTDRPDTSVECRRCWFLSGFHINASFALFGPRRCRSCPGLDCPPMDRSTRYLTQSKYTPCISHCPRPAPRCWGERGTPCPISCPGPFSAS